MTNPIVSFLTAASLVYQGAMAANLSDYRSEVLRPAGANEKMSLERLAAIRQALGTSASDIQGLADIQIQKNKRHRIYSSITLKDIMQNGVAAVMRAKALDAPIPFDPSWTPEEHRQVLALSERRRCVKGLMESTKANGKSVGLDAIVSQIYSKLAVPEFEVDKKEAAASQANSDSLVAAKFRSLVSAHLALAPLNASGQSVTSILGPVSEVELVDGMVHRLNFGKDKETVQAALSMLLTFRLGEDDVFLATQNCLLEYLKDQQEVFVQRQGEMNSWTNFGLLSRAYEGMKNLVSGVEAVKPKIIQSSADKSRAQDEINDMFEMIQTTDKTAQYLAKLKFFSEGVEKSKEKQFIEKRLQLARLVIPFLEDRARTAAMTHRKLGLLSSSQVNYLLDMFLQLKGKDLPVVQEMSVMGELFAQANERIRGSTPEDKLTSFQENQMNQLAADFMYYRVIGSQLTDLQEKLASEVDNAAARTRELELLRKN